MGRAIGAVAAGAVLWAVLWNGGTLGLQAAFPDLIDPEQPLTNRGVLGGYIAYSVILSALAGYVTAAVRGPGAMRTVWVLAWIQLALGIVFEVVFWSMTPVWYHLIFLALLVPATVRGGMMRTAAQTA